MSQESANIITMCAFGAHSLKEVSRGQLASAAKFFLKGTEGSWCQRLTNMNLSASCHLFYEEWGGGYKCTRSRER